MDKYLFIGDIHGNLKLVKFLLKNFTRYKLCFIGDIVDSGGIRSSAEEVECLHLILKSDCELIRGNHEESYLNNSMRCSGWSPVTDILLKPLHKDIKIRSKYFIYFEEHNLLITHAGLSKTLWNNQQLTLPTLKDRLNHWVQLTNTPKTSPIHWIGSSRGGSSPVSGILWCDYNKDFEPIDGLNQIFGHTSWIDADKDSQRSKITNGIRSIGNNYCIDCLNREYTFLEFDTKTGVFTEVHIPEYAINFLPGT